MRLSEPITKIGMKIDPYYQLQKRRPMTLVSGGIGCEYSRRFPGEGRQATVGLTTTAIFSVFVGYFFGYFDMRPMLLYGDTQSVVSFSVIPKCMTLNDLTGYFALNSVFTPVWLAETVRLPKRIA